MLKLSSILAAAATLGACVPTPSRLTRPSVTPATPPGATTVADFQVVNGGEFQSFVKMRRDQLCAVVTSQADWDRYMEPAATMGQSRPFAPPADFWETRAIYLLARVSPADTSPRYLVERVERSGDKLTIRVALNQPPRPSSGMISRAVMVAVPRPVATTVTFNEDGATSCTAYEGGSRPPVYNQ